MIVPMKQNEPIAWNIQRTVRRALRENAISENWVTLTLSPEDWDALYAFGEQRVGQKVYPLPDENGHNFISLYSAGRALHIYCNPKQAPDTIDIALTADVSPEVFA